jgi:hypothetical protein
MSRSNTRSFASALILTAVSGAAGLLAFYVVYFPTSDFRTRFYILIGLSRWSFTIRAFLVFTLIGFCSSWLAGWRNRWSTVGVLLGGLVPLALIYSRVMGYAVWMHDEDVTALGRVTRIVLSMVILGCAWWMLRAEPVRNAAA